MDRRTVLALSLVLVVLVGWSALKAKFSPPPKPVRPNATQSAAPGSPAAHAAPSAAGTSGAAVATDAGAPVAAAPAAGSQPEHTYVLETDEYRAVFSNRGARLLSFELKKYAASYGASRYAENPAKRPAYGKLVPEGDRVTMTGEPTLALELGSGGAGPGPQLANTVYAEDDSTDAAGQIRRISFSTRDSAGFTLRQTWRAHPGSYVLDYVVETSVPQAWRLTDYSLSLRSWPLMNEANYVTDRNGVRSVSFVGKDIHHDRAAGIANKAPVVHEGVVHWAGVQSHYFMALVAPLGAEGRMATSTATLRVLSADELKLRHPDARKQPEPTAQTQLVMPVPPSGAGAQHFLVYMGPSDYSALAKAGGPLELERAADMGWGWLVPVSKILLWLLRLINTVVHNWGLSILLMATLVRVALHPLNMSSMKNMRAMQRLQPEMERIKEKYKNDATAQNAAIMALYKDNNVSPAGGCLPMFLQMPILFAMYQVISNTIDLRMAPFVGWIHDLSAPDVLFSVGGFPIRLLPVLSAGTGWLSQRFTPTDPRQSSTMYMMNIFMLVVFYNFPAGLVFYYTLFNLFNALQQWLAIRGDGTNGSGAVVVQEAQAKGRQR